MFATGVPIRVVVSQISPPIRVVLLCAVAFLGAYMLFLRPKDEAFVEPAPAPNVQTGEPAVSEPGKVAEAAQDAVDAANSQLEAQESVDGVDAGEAAAAGSATGTRKGAKGNAAAPGAVPADLTGVPRPVKRAIRQEKVLALLFWNGKSADDKAVRAALRDVDTWDGRVMVHTAPIKRISKWGRISRGVNVDQSPTVVIVDTKLRAEALVGYVDAKTIDQAVADALRTTKDGLIEDPYLEKINAVCAEHYGPIIAVPDIDEENGPTAEEFVEEMRMRHDALHADFKAVKAPKRWRAFRAAAVRDHAAHSALLADWDAYLGSKPSRLRLARSVIRFAPREHKLVRRNALRMDRRHVVSCGRSR
jgi:hypothetical protein